MILIICSLIPMHLLVYSTVEQERFVPYAILRKKNQLIRNELVNSGTGFSACSVWNVCNGTKHSWSTWSTLIQFISCILLWWYGMNEFTQTKLKNTILQKIMRIVGPYNWSRDQTLEKWKAHESQKCNAEVIFIVIRALI